MKSQLIAIVAAVLLVGCGESQQSPTGEPAEPVAEVPSQQSAPPAEVEPVESVAEAVQPELPTAKPPDISIHDAARDENIEAVKQHLDAEADVNAKDEGEKTPLHSAAYEGHKKIAELLIAKGADVNAKGYDGSTPLHSATKEVVELLIANGADVNAKDDNGETSLNWAIFKGKTEIADLLRKHGGKTKKELEAAGK